MSTANPAAGPGTTAPPDNALHRGISRNMLLVFVIGDVLGAGHPGRRLRVVGQVRAVALEVDAELLDRGDVTAGHAGDALEVRAQQVGHLREDVAEFAQVHRVVAVVGLVALEGALDPSQFTTQTLLLLLEQLQGDGSGVVRCLVFLGQWWKEYCFER